MDRNASSGVDFAEDWVALRKESVDRNPRPSITGYFFDVALRKESVDRNNGRLRAIQNTQSRSPQGERG